MATESKLGNLVLFIARYDDLLPSDKNSNSRNGVFRESKEKKNLSKNYHRDKIGRCNVFTISQLQSVGFLTAYRTSYVIQRLLLRFIRNEDLLH